MMGRVAIGTFLVLLVAGLALESSAADSATNLMVASVNR